MNRSEIRREKRKTEKKKKTYIMTDAELYKIRDQEYQRARKEILGKSSDIAEQVFKMMLVIPANVLISDYWQKTARTRIPRFVEDCLGLYDSWSKGNVDMDEMMSLAEEYSGMTFKDDSGSIYDAVDRNEKKR